MEQYVPDVSPHDVERVVARDYPPEHHEAIHEKIRGIDVREKVRVILACLKNGAGDLQKLEGELANAEGWWREIISEAEYPNYTKKMFRIARLSKDEEARIIEKDKSQYLAWLQREDAGPVPPL